MYVNLGLIGHPLSHTLSPTIHTHFLEVAGINGGYSCFDSKDASELPELIALLRKYSFSGVNLTVPYKIEIIKYCDILDDSAMKAGAVNTLHFKANKLCGHNTDVFGFSKMLENTGISVAGKKVLLLGAGGAARSVAAHLKSFKPQSITIINRTQEHGEMLCSIFGLKADVTTFENFKGGCYDIIINSTSISLNGDAFPIIDAEITEAAVDLQYKPFITPFLSNYQNMPLKKINGFTMLVWQAYRSFNIWTGADPVPDIERLSRVAYGLREVENV